MLQYEKLSPREARRAWPKIIPNAVACETQVRDLQRAEVAGVPHLDIPGKRAVRCLYSPAENRVLVECGMHFAGEISEANGAGGSRSPFPGFFMVKGSPA